MWVSKAAAVKGYAGAWAFGKGVLQWGKRVGEVERNVGRERAQSPSEGLACKSHPKESVMRISTGDCACGATIVSYRGERVWVDNCFSSRRHACLTPDQKFQHSTRIFRHYTPSKGLNN